MTGRQILALPLARPLPSGEPMNAPAPDRFRLFYVDDSGSSASGIVVYSWLECGATSWRAGLQSWLNLRETLEAKYRIPVGYQLHAATFAGGHGNPGTDLDWNRRKHQRGEVMQVALAHLAGTDGISVGTVYRRTNAPSRLRATPRRRLPASRRPPRVGSRGS
jgi:hypothetical protein